MMAGVVRRDGLREKAARAIANANNGGLTEHEPDEGDYYLLDKVLRILGLDAVPDVPPDPPAEHEDRLAELHANYHDQPGNLLWSDDCGYERCDFWAVATFPGVLVDAADVRARTLEDAAEPGALVAAAERGLLTTRDYLLARAAAEREGSTRPPADTDTGRGQ